MARRGGNTAELQSTLMDHVKELRNRGMIVALTLIVGSVLAYTFKDQLFNMLLTPLEGQKLISLTPGGSLSFIMNLSIFSGFAVATPFLIYHLYGFLRPMMPEKMRRNAISMFLFSMILLVGGIAFAYFLALPGALKFLFDFSEGYIEMSELSADSYLGFFIRYLLGLGLIFQTPLVLLFIHWVHPLTPKGLMKSERWVVVVSFVAAALITPTQDPVNLMIVALPTIAVYQIGVAIIVYGVYRDRRIAKKVAVRSQKRELAAVRHAVAERKKLNVAPVRPMVAAAAVTAPEPYFEVTLPPSAIKHAPAPQKKVASMDVFLPQPRVKAPELSMVHRAEVNPVPRPAERAVQTYRTRKTIDGFGRGPAALAPPVKATVAPQPVKPMDPMQNMMSKQSMARQPRMSVDGILPAILA